MNAVDTNILIYAHGPRDPLKQQTAEHLVRSLPDTVLLWQVACEFISASRKLTSFGFNRQKAWQELRKLQRAWALKLPSLAVLNSAERLLDDYSLSFWDAMIIAASLEGGVTCLYSEDFDAYGSIEGLKLVNPFKAAQPS